MKSLSLSPLHYAAKWPTDVVRTPAELTKLGAEFVDFPEGHEKERLLVELLQRFHGYLLKYVSMILRGRLPMQKNGLSREVNKDTHYCVVLSRATRPLTAPHWARLVVPCIWLLEAWMRTKSMTS
jgi:hypothetical protein